MKSRITEILRKMGLLRASFRVYEFLKVMAPRTLFRNSRYLGKTAPDGMPIPPLKLIVLVAGHSDISAFLKGGEIIAQSILDILQKNGVDINDFQAILDFGCGCGRVTRWWHSLKNPAIFGTDYNQKSIRWCKQHLAFAQFDTNRLSPPLIYDHDRFDFIYAISVFTHLSEPLQTLWINELSRTLKPGGYLLITVHGEQYLDALTQSEQEKFAAGQLVVKDGEVAGTNMCSAHHPEEYIRKELASGFEIVDFIPGSPKRNFNQDMFLLKKRARDLS
jgi:2-polyprenyl-3-methyl-5-hydroxy-6-metoxy-1,4-benzoquinol methylase